VEAHVFSSLTFLLAVSLEVVLALKARNTPLFPCLLELKNHLYTDEKPGSLYLS
jgi:hypothetical protein